MWPFMFHHRAFDSEMLLKLYRLIVSSFVSFLLSLYDLISVFSAYSLFAHKAKRGKKKAFLFHTHTHTLVCR